MTFKCGFEKISVITAINFIKWKQKLHEFKIINFKSSERVKNFAPIATDCLQTVYAHNILNLECWSVYLAFKCGLISYTSYVLYDSMDFAKWSN